MYKNFDFQNDRTRSIFCIICSLSWLAFIIMNAIGLIKLIIRSYSDSDNKISNNIIWGFLTYYIKEHYYYDKYFPIVWKNYYFAIIFLIIFLVAIVAFGLFSLKTNFQRDEYIFNGLIGTFSRYHFVPLICGTCLFLSGIFKNSVYKGWNYIKPKEYIDEHLTKYVCDLIFSLIGVVSLTIIKKTIKN